MRKVESMQSGVGTDQGATQDAGSLVVLNERFGRVAQAGTWLRDESEGQRLIVVPALRVDHLPAMLIAGGEGLPTIFGNFRLCFQGLEMPSGFVGGKWMLWARGSPQLQNACFVLGEPQFNIEKAVRGCAALIKKF